MDRVEESERILVGRETERVIVGCVLCSSERERVSEEDDVCVFFSFFLSSYHFLCHHPLEIFGTKSRISESIVWPILQLTQNAKKTKPLLDVRLGLTLCSENSIPPSTLYATFRLARIPVAVTVAVALTWAFFHRCKPQLQPTYRTTYPYSASQVGLQ